ncbi:lipid II:glycine glycyltransferase FemX [Desulfurivibrio alkaliphilus]|uniref:Uncharacterized protein involved in methicillin resistance-like protein n=1 Tax=Desulfurivibrio alkaliphilus (strain DSM 19089 / UNIQEM U267 / AHT2) TaxID=589865 RepID=D6Z4I4_DESAT|nr:GNAT family N-acetyltransferase [Desulfurivibrio alkaliphilus]ADH86459.1 Uncharacterized protein involved in methicillin resistance-like protein [Desulfurivibrio alkaliphilus AHT 2]
MVSELDQEWDAFLAANRHGYHEQTAMYGRIRTGYGFECERAVVRQGGIIVGGVQVLAQSTPLGKFARIFAGPLAAGDEPGILARVVSELEQLVKSKSYVSLRIDTLPTQQAARDALSAAGFRESDAWFGGKLSLVAPLDYTDDELLASIDRKTRNYIRGAERAGVVIRVGDDADLEDFYNLYLMTAAHQGFEPFARDYIKYIASLLGPAGRFRLFVAYHEGEPVAAKSNMIAGGRSYASWVGMHRGEKQRKLRATELLHYTVMRWARDQGCDLYDLGGTEAQKKKVARDTIDWPVPMRKFYGPFRYVMRHGMHLGWSIPWAHRKINSAAWRMGLLPRMPW